jgi:serine/threonine protein kinase
MCESVYSHKIDEWAVGCMLLEMVIGVPPFRGNTECTCHCSQVTHRNFNSDQLARIFLITGSPSNEMLKRVPCEGHIRGWPKAPRKLERTVEKRLTSDRFRLGGTCVHSITHAEMDNAIGNWSSVIAAMLELDPVSRWTCSQAYEVLTRMVAADKRCAPGGPQAASPSIEASTINGSGSDVPDIMIEIGLSSREEDDTLPLVMRSPERDLPGHNISLFYRHCNDSKHTRLAAEGNRKQAVCGTGLVAGRAHEQTLQLRTGGQEMQRPRIDDGAAETPTRPLPPPDRPYAAMFRKQASMSPPRSRTLYAAKDPLQARAEMHAVGSRQSRAFSRSQSGPASPSVSVSLDGVEQDGVVKQRQLHQQRIWVPSLSSMSPPRTRSEQRMEAFKAQERHKSPEAHKSKSPSPSREQDVVKRVRGTAKLQSSIDQRVSEFQ